MLSGFTPRPLKRLFTANQCWTSFLDAGGLRDIEIEAVTKMLACGTRILGVKEFGCDNPDCHHVKGTVAKLAMRQPFVLFKGLTFQKLCLPGAFRPGDHHNKMLRPG
ncbi:hypothetical protein U9890_25515, partial [Escherichia coli]